MFTTKYVKEDLPTYSELYNEFWLKDYWVSRSFEPHDPKWQELDPYWEIPRYKVLLATACNQFNKMMYIDKSVNFYGPVRRLFCSEYDLRLDVQDYISWHLNDRTYQLSVTRMDEWRPHFAIAKEGVYLDTPNYNHPMLGEDNLPPIYELDLPNGQDNPFVQNHLYIKRYKMSELLGLIELRFVWRSMEGYYTHQYRNNSYPVSMIWDCTHPKFKDLLSIFMEKITDPLGV